MPATHRFRQIAGWTTLAASLCIWPILFGGVDSPFLTIGPWGKLPLLIFASVVLILAGWAPSREGLCQLMEIVRARIGHRRSRASLAVAAFAAVYLTVTLLGQHRPLYPYFHDENSYLIQAHQFAAFRLWEPAHPLADFFDSFQLFTKPVYASAYFPGTAILYVPGVWLHLPPWVTSIAIASAVAGLLFRIVVEILDGVAGLLAIALLFADDVYRECATLTLGQMPCLLYGLAAILAWLRWRQRTTAGRAVWVGVALGLAAVTRPVDALIFGLPIGIAMVGRGPWQLRCRAVAAVAVGVAPFLALQITINRGVTGEFFRTPFRMYADQDYPGTAYGFHPFDSNARPLSTLLQKQSLYHEYLPAIAAHRWATAWQRQIIPLGNYSPARLQSVVMQASPCAWPLLLLLAPLSLVKLTRPTAVVIAGAPLFCLLYVPYVFFFFHYVLPAAAGMILAILAGGRAVEQLLPRWRRAVAAGVVLFTGGLAVAAWPQFDSTITDVAFASKMLADVNTAMANLPHKPAVVLFKYNPERDNHTEPVYNADAAWPDNAGVIRAHDLGSRNIEIIRYYAARQPRRYFYIYDEKTAEVIPLGWASDLSTGRVRFSDPVNR
jgi:hypothetical protein